MATNYMTNNNENKIMYKDLSYKLQGLFFDIRNDLGSGHKESIYQKALEKELARADIKFMKEPSIKIYSKKGEFLGLYRPDFLVEDKIIIELKAVEHISRQETARVYDYLRNSDYELAYLVNFASHRLFIKRLIFTNDRKDNPRMANNPRTWIILFVAISNLFVGIRVVSAAEIDVVPLHWEAGVNQPLEINVSLSAEGESINAVSGKVKFPEDILELEAIKDGNSIISFWVEEPRKEKEGVVFAGIIPGGFGGEKGHLFSLLFKTKKYGSGVVELQNTESFYNDGEGTKAPLKIFQLAFTVKEEGAVVQRQTPSGQDKEPPESFRLEIARDETLFEGKWFVVFVVPDKSSGIARYEIKESRQKILSLFKKGIPAESPHILADQELRSFVWIKAIDKTGNERIVKIAPRNPLAWYENYENWIIMIVGLIIIALVVRPKKQATRDQEQGT